MDNYITTTSSQPPSISKDNVEQTDETSKRYYIWVVMFLVVLFLLVLYATRNREVVLPN
jgi:uncharacterized integral membrane protein